MRTVVKSEPCPCWSARTPYEHGHDGHCCFRDNYDEKANRVTCGHDAAGMRVARRSAGAA